MNILLIGSGGREHAIARALYRSAQRIQLFCIGTNNNPGIVALGAQYSHGRYDDVEEIVMYAQQNAVNWAIIGPEAPLEAGVVDALEHAGIACIGPRQQPAQIETSKSFARDLFRRYGIPGNAQFKQFSDLNGVESFLAELNGNYVIKADGLMAGKGVKVSGDHLHSTEEALEYCKELLALGQHFLIEEKFVGQEFSLMSFTDGNHVAHMPAVQDHKRAFVGDKGPNTGGMGSYSDANHSLPFLSDEDIHDARLINQSVVDALRNEFNEGYRGILYGGFIATREGVRILEYNARFGDPEAMNVLSILETDFVALCEAMINATLSQEHARFAHKATVCKYVVPEGYPDFPKKNQVIDVSPIQNKDFLYFGFVDSRDGAYVATGSRTVAFVGIADTIADAEKIAEAEVSRISGPFFHREDIGTAALIGKRIAMMKELRKDG